MAYFRKRGPYQYQAIIRRRGYPGQSKTFVSMRDAEAWALQVESEMSRGVFVSRVEAERTTLRELLQRYITEITPGHKSYVTERLRLEALSRHSLADRFVATLRSSDFAAFRNERLRSRKPATVVKELGLLSRVFTVAAREWDLAVTNPLATVARPKVRNERLRSLAPEEELSLLNELDVQGRDDHGRLEAGGVRSFWIKPLVQVALETAMRRGELLALTWTNVDLRRRVATLPDTKNGARREVPLTPAAISVLSKLPRSLDGRVFPLTADALKKAFQRAVDRAGLLNFTFHDLRRTATTRLSKKLDLLELARLTGHRQVNVLYQRYYTVSAAEIALKLSSSDADACGNAGESTSAALKLPGSA